MLSNAKKFCKHLIIIFRHVDKILLLETSVCCFYYLINTFNEVKLLQKNVSGRIDLLQWYSA